MEDNRTTTLLRVDASTKTMAELYCNPLDIPVGKFYTKAVQEKLAKINKSKKKK
jgi:hypothetical protein